MTTKTVNVLQSNNPAACPVENPWPLNGSNNAALGSTMLLPEPVGEDLFFEEATMQDDRRDDYDDHDDHDVYLYGHQNPTTFPANFFANPFAVSFPGDIPCPTAIPTATADSTSAPPAPPPVSLDAPAIQKRPSPPLGLVTDEPDKTPDGQFHFIDMADRKAAVRIRNTRISRQYRENKVRRIAELEDRLAAALARIDELESGNEEIK